MKNEKIIIMFGGSFNPPINSHFVLVKEVLSEFSNIEKVIFMPVNKLYDKANLLDSVHRYNMLKLICDKNEKFEVSDIEINSDRQLYTIETLNILKDKYKGYDIWFVIGADNLKLLHTWKTPDELLSKYKLVALSRDSDSVNEIIEKSEFLTKYKDRILTLKKDVRIDLSSTKIREIVKNHKNIKDYVPEDICRYIESNNLYK